MGGNQSITFPKGTVITTNTDGTVSKWTQNKDGKFVNQNGKIATYTQIFPNGIPLDQTGDGVYDQKDFAKFKKMEDQGILGKTLEKGLEKAKNSRYYIRYAEPGIGGPEEASTYTGSLFFKATRNDDSFGGTEYSIKLPKK